MLLVIVRTQCKDIAHNSVVKHLMWLIIFYFFSHIKYFITVGLQQYSNEPHLGHYILNLLFPSTPSVNVKAIRDTQPIPAQLNTFSVPLVGSWKHASLANLMEEKVPHHTFVSVLSPWIMLKAVGHWREALEFYVCLCQGSSVYCLPRERLHSPCTSSLNSTQC